MRLNIPKIWTTDLKTGHEIGGQNFTVENDNRLSFNFKFETLGSKTYTVNNFDYSMVQVRMNMTRTEKNRNKIFGGYHLTTGIFAILSLISYFIPPDSVPGRMGMITTLYLILINSYSSVDAPPDRGFSSIEIWFIGMQSPILLSILEYGLILAIKMYLEVGGLVDVWGKKTTANELFKAIDSFTLIVSVVLLGLFNIIYWLAQ